MQEPQEFNDEITDEDAEYMRQFLLDKKTFKGLLIQSGCSPLEADAEIKKSEYLVGIWDLKKQTESKINDMRKKFNAELNDNKKAIINATSNNNELSTILNKIDRKSQYTEQIFMKISGSERGTLENEVFRLEKELLQKNYIIENLHNQCVVQADELKNLHAENKFLQYEAKLLFETHQSKHATLEASTKNINHALTDNQEENKQLYQHSNKTLSHMFTPVKTPTSLQVPTILEDSSVHDNTHIHKNQIRLHNGDEATKQDEYTHISENNESHSNYKF